VSTLKAAADRIIDRTRQRMRAAIAAIPDGVYRFEDTVDDDGVGTFNIPIKIEIKVSGDRITFDFSGTSRQIKGTMNCPRPATVPATAYALMALVDRKLACNEGLIEAIDVVTEPGSFVHPTFPAPVAARTHTCQRIIDVVHGALAPALPAAAT